LRSTGRIGETPRDGWREILHNFELPDGVQAVRLVVAGPSRRLEAWRIDLDRREVRRAGYALAEHIEAPLPRLEVPVQTGCSGLEGGALESLWVDEDPTGHRRLEIRVTFSGRKDAGVRCRQESQIAVLDARPDLPYAVRLDSDRAATLVLELPEGRRRFRVGLGKPSSRAVTLRIDLHAATAEQEAIAALSP